MTPRRHFLPIQRKTEILIQGLRPAQEDTFLVDEKIGIFAIADGFGGPSIGGEAAKLACESLFYYLSKQAGDSEVTLPLVYRSYLSLSGNILFNAMLYANQKLIQGNQKKSVHSKGGASLLACFLAGRILTVASVGVCQAFLHREGKLAPLNLPQSYRRLRNPFSILSSFINDSVHQTALKIEDRCGIPLSALGVARDLEPEISEYEIQKGDTLLLCTDGKEISSLDALKEKDFTPDAGQRMRAQLEEEQTNDNFAMIAATF